MAFDKEKSRKENRRNANSKREGQILVISVVLAIITSYSVEKYDVSLAGIIFVGILFSLLYIVYQTVFYSVRDHDPKDIRTLFFSRLGYLLFMNMIVIFSCTMSTGGISNDREFFPGRLIRPGGEEIVYITFFASLFILLIFLGLWVYSAFKKKGDV